MSEDLLVKRHQDLDHEYTVQLRWWKLIAVALAVLATVGAIGWQMAAHEQGKARTNATVAKAGEALADQLNVICQNRDPKVHAYAARYKLCQQASDVKAAAGQINSASAAPVPVQTVVVPGGTATSWAVNNATATQTVTAPPLAPVTFPGRDVVITATTTAPGASVTQTVPGPVTTAVVPGPATTATAYVTVPGGTVTQTIPGPASTETVTQTVPGTEHTVTQTVPAPAVTDTITVPGPERTVTVTATAPATTDTTTATDPGATVTQTVTDPPPQ